jgi:diaminopropionate ammonia-lyase
MCRYLTKNPGDAYTKWPAERLALFNSTQAIEFHKNIPGYSETPLLAPDTLAEELGIGKIFIKNESKRFDVKAFKPLGASYAIFHFLSEVYRYETGKVLPIDIFNKPDILKALPKKCFCAATDGNHGRAVAWTARKLGQRAVIFMPVTASAERQKNIKQEQAELVLVPGTFDDCVRECQEQADKNGWQAIADTAYEGNMELPEYIIQGYRTLFMEADSRLHHEDKSLDPAEPGIDLLILPAGVGGLAAAGAGFYTLKYKQNRPKILIVEPDDADCFLLSASAGKPVQSPGKQESIMVGLACGYPSLVAWPVCRDTADAYLAIPDSWALSAMHLYKKYNIISGESGSAGLAGLLALLKADKLADLRRHLGIGKNSRVLCLNTEGDTDPEKYREITGKAL